MKVKLLKDVMLPANGTADTGNTGGPEVGAKGDVVELSDAHAKAYIKKGLAEEAKGNKDAATRETKPAAPAAETKPLTSAVVAKPGPAETKANPKDAQ